MPLLRVAGERLQPKRRSGAGDHLWLAWPADRLSLGTHMPFIRGIAGQPGLLINTGSVGLSYDGDPRASYLILEESAPSIRRVEYNIEKELKALASCGLPGSEWTAKMLRTSSPQMP